MKGSKIVYYASNANMVNFYSIDAETGAFSKKVYRVAGENATWKFEENVLTISGTGEMFVDSKVHYRYPVSSTSGGFGYSSSDNAWAPIREKVEKIVIEKGITSIPDNAFAYFDNLTEVEIKSGVKSIGEKAFYSCDALSKITIPSSVTSIGEDFLWTGFYWIGDESHVVRATIFAPENSYAMKYAEKNGIRSTIKNDIDDETGDNVSESILKAEISGIKESYAYNGKAQKPKVTVKLEGKVLKEGTDYTVSYKNNSRTGKASVEIKGIHTYSGTVTKTYKIVPKKAAGVKAASPKSRTIKVTWKKDPQADGYQIQYAKNSKFTRGKKNVTIKKKSTVSKKISKITKSGKYHVRVRAYKKIDGKKCYGSWSKSVKVKCK